MKARICFDLARMSATDLFGLGDILRHCCEEDDLATRPMRTRKEAVQIILDVSKAQGYAVPTTEDRPFTLSEHLAQAVEDEAKGFPYREKYLHDLDERELANLAVLTFPAHEDLLRQEDAQDLVDLLSDRIKLEKLIGRAQPTASEALAQMGEQAVAGPTPEQKRIRTSGGVSVSITFQRDAIAEVITEALKDAFDDVDWAKMIDISVE